MITATCTGCGDTHLCAGTRPADTNPTLLDTLRQFTAVTFEANPIDCVSSAGAYLAYLNWCTAHDVIPASQRRFIPAMEELGYRRIKRSTMKLAGLSWRAPQNVGRHHRRDLTTV